MITSIHIRGFKTLLDVSIDLGSVNVFIGANGSGKSNILEAVGVLSAASSSVVNDESLLRRGVRPGLPILYKTSFQDEKTPQAIIFDIKTAEGVKYSVSLHNPLEKPSKNWQYKTESLYVGEKKLFSGGVKTWINKEVGLATASLSASEPSSPEVYFLQRLQDYAIYTPNTPSLRGLLPDSIRGAVGLQGGGLAEAVDNLAQSVEESNFLEEALELLDWVGDVKLSRSASLFLSPAVPRQQNVLVFQDRFMKKDRNSLTAYDASEGALYVLFALVLARSPNMAPLFAVDNFDQALNPRLLQRLMQKFCSWILKHDNKPRQVLMTVHNPIVLDGLPINDDRIRLFTVDRDNQGITRVQRVVLTEELQQLASEQKWPLSRLWVMGHLGGMPDV